MDPGTGRLTLHIPLLSDHSQRGNLNFDYSLSYSDMGPWEEYCDWDSNYCMWYPDEVTGAIGVTPVMDGAMLPGGDGIGNPAAIEETGAIHVVGVTNTSCTSGTCFYESVDQSGFQEGPCDAGFGCNSYSEPYAITNKNGVSFVSEYDSDEIPLLTKVEDVNGNQMTWSPATSINPGSAFGVGTSWTMTDTLGRSWSLAPASDTSACPSSVGADNAEIWTAPGPSSTTRTFTFCYSTTSAVPDPSELPPADGTTMYYYGVDVDMLTAAVLPDGTTWQFAYDSWGNISQVTLPTGGTFSYTYSTVLCDYCALRAVSTKTTPDGTWDYDEIDDSYNATKITDPASHDTVYYTGNSTFGDTTVTRITYYAGSESSGNVLKIENKSYTPGAMDAGGTPMPIPSATTTSYPVGGGNYITSGVVENYDSGFTTYLQNAYGPYYVTVPYASKGETHYGFSGPTAMPSPNSWINIYGTVNTGYMPSPGSAMSTTSTSLYALSYPSYLTAANLLSLPYKQQVFDGSGNLCSETDYAYDGSGGADSSGVSEQHVSAPFSVRGNLTSITRQLFTGGCASSPSETAETTTQSVYDTGMPYYSVDPLGNHNITYGYSSTYYGAYPTTVANALSQSTTLTYDFNTGLVKTSTDPNSAETQFYSYDCMLRPTEIIYPDGGEETWSANYSAGTDCSSSTGVNSTGWAYTRKITSSKTYTLGVSDDSQGRQLQTKTTIDTATSVCASSGYVYQDTGYNSDGELYTSSNPDCTSTTSDDVKAANTYDGLGRVTQVTDQDGSVQHISYAANSSTSPPTYCTTTTDEASHVKTSCADAIGRATSVWEDPSGVDYETDYTYDPVGNMLSVTQKGGASSTYWRTRTFTYDSLSRLTQAVNPESGTISYTYDGDSNVLTKVSPQANQTGSLATTITYCYDAGNRLTGKRYTSSSCSSPDVAYSYDSSSCLGAPSCYNIGRRTGMTDAAGSEAWSYDSMGRPIEDERTTNSVTKTTSYAYNYDGTLAMLTHPLGRTITYSPTRTYSPSAVSQPYQAEDNPNSIDYANSVVFEASGQLASLANGSSLVSTYYYWPQLQPCRMAVNLSTETPPNACSDSSHNGTRMDLVYNLNSGSADNGNVAGITNKVTTTRSQVFSYDSRNRIYQAGSAATSGTNCWSEQYSIDAWSNLSAVGGVSGYTGCSGESWTLSVNTQNQINTTSSPYFAYDAAGNVTSAPSPVGAGYTYDAENHVTQVAASSTVGYVYDGDGKRLEKTSSGSAYELFWYDVNGNVLDETDGSGNLSSEYVFFGSGRIARRDSSSNVYYYFGDHLGSARVVTNSSGTILDDCDYFPYGMLMNSSCVTSGNHYLFTGKERDTVNEGGDDYFGARYYMSAYGRFLIPDNSDAPSPVPYADYSNPQSLNLYTYVRNNPLGLIDVDGHCTPPTWDISEGQPTSSDDHPNAYDNACGNDPCPPGAICVTAIASLNDSIPVNDATIEGELGSLQTQQPQPQAQSSQTLLGKVGQFFHGRSPGQSFGACVDQNISLLTFGEVDPSKLLSGGMLLAEAVGTVFMTSRVAQTNPMTGGTFYTTLATAAAQGLRAFGASPGAVVVAATAANAAGVTLAVAGAATVGGLIGSAANCASVGVGY